MKTPIRIFIVFLLLTLAGKGHTQQARFNHFYMHGWTQNSGGIYNLGWWCNSKFSPSWKQSSNPHLYTYNSVNGFASQYPSVYNSLLAAHNEGEYIGVGYSAGGLMCRMIAANTATPDGEDGWFNTFVNGFVTLDAPNGGARFASHWQEWLFNSMLSSVKIARGDYSFLAYGGYAITLFWAPILATIGSLVQTATPMALDLQPSSGFIYAINTSASRARQASGSRGWVAVSGDIEANSHGIRWRLPGLFGTQAIVTGYDDASINSAMDDYQAKIDDAHAKAGYHDWKVNHLRGFWNGLARAWHRMRRGDWNASADGWGDYDSAWEWTVAERGPSDSFISLSSQENLSEKTAVRINGNINHGGAVLCGVASNTGTADGTQGANGVYHAFTDRLNLIPHN